jgi:hypothetical protein
MRLPKEKSWVGSAKVRALGQANREIGLPQTVRSETTEPWRPVDRSSANQDQGNLIPCLGDEQWIVLKNRRW